MCPGTTRTPISRRSTRRLVPTGPPPARPTLTGPRLTRSPPIRSPPIRLRKLPSRSSGRGASGACQPPTAERTPIRTVVSTRPPAALDVVVHHARRLHQGVGGGRSEELEAPPFELLGHGLRLVSDRRQIGHGHRTWVG